MPNHRWRYNIILWLIGGVMAFNLAAQVRPTKVTIRSDALRDISELFLYLDGEPQLPILRAKPSLTLYPKEKRTVKMPEPIRNFDWQKVLAQLNQDRVLNLSERGHGRILGNQNGSLLFAKHDTLFAQLPQNWSVGQLHAVRESHILYSIDGKPLATVAHHIADVEVTELHNKQRGLVRVFEQNKEIMQGDWLLPSQTILPEDLFLHAAQEEVGVVIGGLEPREIFAQGDIVIVQHAKPLSVGLIMGLYQAGPDIQHTVQRTIYVDESSWLVRGGMPQPDLKVGEVVIVHSQANLSYGYVLSAQSAISIGALSGRP